MENNNISVNTLDFTMFACTASTLIALHLFVFPLQLGGCGILGVGVWLSVTQGNFATLSSSLPSLSAANLLIAVGTIIMVIGCLGCVGAVKESRPLLLTVSRMVLDSPADFKHKVAMMSYFQITAFTEHHSSRCFELSSVCVCVCARPCIT